MIASNEAAAPDKLVGFHTASVSWLQNFHAIVTLGRPLRDHPSSVRFLHFYRAYRRTRCVPDRVRDRPNTADTV